MLVLFIPWVLIVMMAIGLLCLVKKKWTYATILFVSIVLINRRGECIPLRLSYPQKTESVSLKVVSFNINGSTGDIRNKGYKIKEFLRRYSPDIVFIAEYNEQNPKLLDSLLNKEFKYSTYRSRLLFQYFYSNIPLFNINRLKDYEGKHIGIFTCSTIYQGDTIDLYGCHLVSNNYNINQEREGVENIGGEVEVWKYVRNIQDASRVRYKEASIAAREILKSTHHVIVLGDLNDVGGSEALRVLEKSGLKDAWWEGGVGYGATFYKPLPFRIDHIMHTKGLTLDNIRVLDSEGNSDHNALYAEFSIDK